ncbi:3D domain-containing protein [Lysinibacillus sp. LZ02]|uniref:3D domain-containing protein n=1 Tax=Lysinibacillus sp. LZ02 TaxID=3420668 RepID=UPI003D362D38
MRKQSILSLLGVLLLSMTLFVTSADAATHTVQKGDTLYGLAKKYNTTVNTLKSLNNLSNDTIRVNEVLTVSEESKSDTTAKADVQDEKEVKTLEVTATAFTASCRGCSGVTSTGINLKKNPDAKVIAVDPKVIPLGTKVWVEGYGEAVAGDTGGAIKGNKIDVFMPTKDKAYSWGRRTVTVKILE